MVWALFRTASVSNGSQHHSIHMPHTFLSVPEPPIAHFCLTSHSLFTSGHTSQLEAITKLGARAYWSVAHHPLGVPFLCGTLPTPPAGGPLAHPPDRGGCLGGNHCEGADPDQRPAWPAPRCRPRPLGSPHFTWWGVWCVTHSLGHPLGAEHSGGVQMAIWSSAAFHWFSIVWVWVQGHLFGSMLSAARGAQGPHHIRSRAKQMPWPQPQTWGTHRHTPAGNHSASPPPCPAKASGTFKPLQWEPAPLHSHATYIPSRCQSHHSTLAALVQSVA